MLAGKKVRKVAIIGGNRIPFARSNTDYFGVSNQEMLTTAIDGLVDRYQLQGERMGEVTAGAVMKHARDFNLVRECVIGSKLAPETPAYDLQQRSWWRTRLPWGRLIALLLVVSIPPPTRRLA